MTVNEHVVFWVYSRPCYVRIGLSQFVPKHSILNENYRSKAASNQLRIFGCFRLSPGKTHQMSSLRWRSYLPQSVFFNNGDFKINDKLTQSVVFQTKLFKCCHNWILFHQTSAVDFLSVDRTTGYLP